MKRNRILIIALALVLAIGLAIPVIAASTVTDSDWLENTPNPLVKCEGGDCDHTTCDEAYRLSAKQCATYIGAPLPFMWCVAAIRTLKGMSRK